MKTHVYSWRVSAELKSDLQSAARQRNLSLSAVLDEAAREWLARSASAEDGDEKQKRLMAAASKCFGSITGTDPRRAETASDSIRKSLRRRYGR
jgi:predicted transcriptional regulator